MTGSAGQVELVQEKWLKFYKDKGIFGDEDIEVLRKQRELAGLLKGADKKPDRVGKADIDNVDPQVERSIMKGAGHVQETGAADPIHGSVGLRQYLPKEASEAIGKSGDVDLPFKAPWISWGGRDIKKADRAIQEVEQIIKKENPGLDIQVHGLGAGKQTNRSILIDGEKKFEIVLDSGTAGIPKGTHIFGQKIQTGHNISEISGTDAKIVKLGQQTQELSEQTSAIQPWTNPGRVRDILPGEKTPKLKVDPDEGRLKDQLRYVVGLSLIHI